MPPVTSVYLGIIACWLVVSPILSFGQTGTFPQLEEKVYQLNNALKYSESQRLLLPIIQGEQFSADEKYHAALLLSFTYKRLLDYQATLRFLETARQFARQTKLKEPYLAAVRSNEAFVYFDTHQYKKADSVMNVLAKNQYRYIDLENKAKLVMQQGYLQYLAKQYTQAEATYTKAIGWLRTASPCDLPMIYAKEMQLYAAMNRMDKLKTALRESTRSADSCAITKYHLYTYEVLLEIYKSRKDAVGIIDTERKVDSLNLLYARAENIAALHNQKETLLLREKDQMLQAEQTQRRYLLLGLGGSGLLVAGLLAGLFVHNRRKRQAEGEVIRMKQELKDFLALRRAEPASKISLRKEALDALSERQRDVMTGLAGGLSNREIADKLFVSENTVKYHIKNIYQLLDIKDRKDLLTNFRN